MHAFPAGLGLLRQWEWSTPDTEDPQAAILIPMIKEIHTDDRSFLTDFAVSVFPLEYMSKAEKIRYFLHSRCY